MSKGRAVGLHIPDQDAGKALAIKPKEFEHQLAALPLGNPDEAFGPVWDLVHALNRTPMAWKTRYRLMELVRPQAALVYQTLTKRFLSQPLPVPDRLTLAITNATALQHELAIGYMAAIETMHQGSVLFMDHARMAELVHRALSHLSRQLLACALAYRPTQAHIWGDLHRLMRYAEVLRLDQRQVEDAENRIQRRTSVTAAYLRPAVLALAQPAGLRQDELLTVHTALEQWSALVTIGPFAPEQPPRGGLHTVHLDSDHPPRHTALDDEISAPEQCRHIDTAELARALAGKEQERLGPLAQRLSEHLRKRLARRWYAPGKRTFRRHPGEAAQMEMVTGLTAAWAAFEQSARQDRQARAVGKKSHFSSYNVSSASDPQPDVWDVFAYSPSEVNGAEAFAESDTEADLPVRTLSVCDQGAGGFRLSDEDPGGAPCFLVGDLLAVRSRTTELDPVGPWMLALVRWLRQGPDHSLQLGTEVVAPGAEAIAAARRLKDGTWSEYFRVILVPSVPQLHPEPTLVTAAGLFHKGDVLRLEEPHNGVEQLFLSEPVEQTGLVTRFRYDVENGG